MTTMKHIDQIESTEHPKVWDLPVRVFHWTLVTAVIGAFVTNRLGVSYFKYHVWFGYVVIVAISFRIVWGFVGTYHARFLSFIRGPIQTVQYGLGLLRGQHQHYAGHNPIGALMVLALLASLGVQAVAGLFGNDEIFNVGPLNGYVSNDISLFLTSLHRKLFYGIAVAVALHVLAVFAHLIFFKENLVVPMITGRKPVYNVVDAIVIKSSRAFLAIAISLSIAFVLFYIVSNAPVPISDASNL